MKQKYVMPNVEIVNTLLKATILAGSEGTGSWTNPEGGGDIDGGGGGYPGSSTSKEHNFNAWETWDEY